MDNLVFEESINTEISSSEFVDKQWLYVNDNNNSSYSGQVVIDTTSLSNCGSYINWSEAFLAFPMVLQAQSTNAPMSATAPLDFMMGLKSGFWQIIHSLTVEFNNGSVVQQTPFLNVFNSFKALTSWSEGDLADWGAITGFYPDTATSWMYNNFADAINTNVSTMSPAGTGICNNRNAPYVVMSTIVGAWSNVAAGVSQALVTGTNANAVSFNFTTQATSGAQSIQQSYNKGFYQRQAWLAYNPTLNAGGSLLSTSLNQTALMSGNGATTNISGYSAIFQSYVQSAVTTRAIIFDAVIRLKDIADFFQKVPMLKGSTMRFYINTNQAYLTYQCYSPQANLAAPAANATGASYGVQTTAGAMVLTSTPIILGGGGTCPVMIASQDLGQGGYNLAPIQAVGAETTYQVAVGLSIVKTQFTQFTQSYTAPITSCRLYAPAYTMNPIAEQRYLSLAPTKKIVYNDIFYYSYQNISTGTFSYLVTNGIPNVRGILVVPMINKSANGTLAAANPFSAAATTTSTILSPFSTTGGTPDPISLTNFNIQVSGKNLFINNELYDYEQFSQQLCSSNQLNGSLTTSLASGLIGMSEFESLYRYYYGNVSRSIPSEDGVAKAIQVVGTNNSSVPVDFFVFVEFERTITVDIRTGARIA